MADHAWVVIDVDSTVYMAATSDPSEAIRAWLADEYAGDAHDNLAAVLAGDINCYDTIDAPDSDSITSSEWWIVDRAAAAGGEPWQPGHPPHALGSVYLAGPIPDLTNERVRCRLGLDADDGCLCDGGCGLGLTPGRAAEAAAERRGLDI